MLYAFDIILNAYGIFPIDFSYAQKDNICVLAQYFLSCYIYLLNLLSFKIKKFRHSLRKKLLSIQLNFDPTFNLVFKLRNSLTHIFKINKPVCIIMVHE